MDKSAPKDSKGGSRSGAAEGVRVVQYSCSWILMLLMYSRQSLNFSITSIVANVLLNVKMFAKRQVDSSVSSISGRFAIDKEMNKGEELSCAVGAYLRVVGEVGEVALNGSFFGNIIYAHAFVSLLLYADFIHALLACGSSHLSFCNLN